MLVLLPLASTMAGVGGVTISVVGCTTILSRSTRSTRLLAVVILFCCVAELLPAALVSSAATAVVASAGFCCAP